jgi:hypothetical protein
VDCVCVEAVVTGLCVVVGSGASACSAFGVRIDTVAGVVVALMCVRMFVCGHVVRVCGYTCE